MVDHRNVETQTDDEINYDEFFDSVMDNPTAIPKKKRKRRKKTNPPRCRRCGKCYTSEAWRSFHPIPTQATQEVNRKQNRHLINQPERMPHLFCYVSDSQFEPGFPCLDMNKTMPRRKKNQITVEEESS